MEKKKQANQYTKAYEKGQEHIRTTPLRNMPQEVRNYVLQIQSKRKETRPTQSSLELTIYQIIREHKAFSEKPILFGGLK